VRLGSERETRPASPRRPPSLAPSASGTWEEWPISYPPNVRGDPDDEEDDPVGEGVLTVERWRAYLEERLNRSDLSAERQRQVAADARALLAPPRQVLGVAHDRHGWRADALYRLCCAMHGGVVLELDGVRALVRDGRRGERVRVPRVASS
jgi:hypothetical protein